MVVRVHGFSYRNFDEKSGSRTRGRSQKIGCFQEILKSRSDGPGVRVTESVRPAKSIIKHSMALFLIADSWPLTSPNSS